MRDAVHRQTGFSLIVVLLLLIVLTVLGVGAAKLSLVNELGARSDRDTEIAFQAAEAALLDAEIDVLGPNPATAARLCAFSPRDVVSFVAGCGGPGDAQGLCAPAAAGAAPVWMTVDLSPASRTSVEYGRFTGQRYATGAGAIPAALPRYVIEVIRSSGGWQVNQLESASAERASNIFRVTAIGFGVREETQVVLQTNLYKPTVSAGCP
jgi:type IV pilus assembly protein PilX